MTKFIDLKEEQIIAAENIRLFHAPKQLYAWYMAETPAADPLKVVGWACQAYKIDRNLYRMIDEVHDQHVANKFGYKYKSIYKNER
jgi:hypothetical protein